ncbi:hypothetical protein, partial [Mesorhizobium sp. M7A.F.Ca.US.014.04.1.1]|uniref:hypothetical protein n=1 Tax=Mesorhizobium sp. M7A.F.Ca.US.014.04.1.1 TaxID=2496744 RepID=UPI0019D06E07
AKGRGGRFHRLKAVGGLALPAEAWSKASKAMADLLHHDETQTSKARTDPNSSLAASNDIR